LSFHLFLPPISFNFGFVFPQFAIIFPDYFKKFCDSEGRMRSGLLLLLLVAFALAKTEKAEEEAKESNAVDDADGDHNENENENGGEKSKREASPNPPKTDFSNGEF
jgi:hypothetical protein